MFLFEKSYSHITQDRGRREWNKEIQIALYKKEIRICEFLVGRSDDSLRDSRSEMWEGEELWQLGWQLNSMQDHEIILVVGKTWEIHK